ncbi:MAG TPA: type 4a pilus biogenesis protein PilO [Gemmatimonadaceae bacterium]|nr:type 4a pilus biogenesis protein PilO [Gemmatimonadaceae bacterium]
MALLPKGQREQVLFLIGFLAVVGAGAYWYFIFSPKSEEIALREERVEALVEMNRKAQLEMAKGNVSELRAQLAEYQENLALIRTLVPQGNELPALLEQVSTAARRVGLDLASVDPQPIIEGSDYDTYRYNISLLGSYHDLGVFLTNVGTLTRIVLPANLTLQQPSNPTAAKMHQKPNESVVEARFQLQTYVARKAPLEEPPTKAGAGR